MIVLLGNGEMKSLRRDSLTRQPIFPLQGDIKHVTIDAEKYVKIAGYDARSSAKGR